MLAGTPFFHGRSDFHSADEVGVAPVKAEGWRRLVLARVRALFSGAKGYGKLFTVVVERNQQRGMPVTCAHANVSLRHLHSADGRCRAVLVDLPDYI